MLNSTTSCPSIRRRGGSAPPSSTSATPRRCSSTVSLELVDSLPFDDEDAEIDASQARGEGFPPRLIGFDPLNLRSSMRRRERMLASVEAKESDNGELMSMSCISPLGEDVCFIPQKYHYTVMELEPYRLVGDPEMDSLLQYLSRSKDASCGGGAFDDVISYAAKEYEQGCTQLSPPLQLYKHYYEHVPEWVDYDQIQRGIDVFLAYLPSAGCSLFYRSLVGGFSIPKIQQVLIATRYLVPSHIVASGSDLPESRTSVNRDRDRERSIERLADTGGFLACCFAPSSSTDSVTVCGSSCCVPATRWQRLGSGVAGEGAPRQGATDAAPTDQGGH